MSATRRIFLRNLVRFGSVAVYFWMEGAVFAAPDSEGCSLPPFTGATRYIPREASVVARISAAELAEAPRAQQLARFRDAISKMKALSASDLAGWEKQIAQHCIHSAGAGNVHFSGQFLPWHRAWLYFFERTLRKLSGDDDLRLAYWDWENENSRALPAIYAASGQSLFHESRDYHGIDMQEADVRPMLAAPGYQLLGGSAAHNPGAAFGGPHAHVHNAFGGDMSDLERAPRDPLFYAHHGNVDRMWSSWVRAGHTMPDFGAARAYFFDEERKPRYILFNDLRDERKLGYEYSSEMKTPVHLKELRQYPLFRKGAAYTGSPATVAGITGKESEAAYLIIRNIRNLERLSRSSYIYGIFADRPRPGWLNHMDANYLGKVATVRRAGENPYPGAPLTCALDVSEKLVGSLRRQKGMLNLTVSPLSREGKTGEQSIPLVADAVLVVR